MTLIDLFGYFACLFVFATFYSRDALRLRGFAILSNACFLVYGLGLDLLRVTLLHAVLLPMNAVRMVQALQGMRKSDSVPVRVTDGLPLGPEHYRVRRLRRAPEAV
jgi:hypothetical protein